MSSAPRRKRDPNDRSTLTLSLSTALKTQLELEAWECQLTLPAYVRGLLERRGKWARTVGRAGGYDLMAEIPRVSGRDGR